MFAADDAEHVRRVQDGLAGTNDVLKEENAWFKAAARARPAPPRPGRRRGTPHQEPVNAGPFERPLLRDGTCPIGTRYFEDETRLD